MTTWLRCGCRARRRSSQARENTPMATTKARAEPRMPTCGALCVKQKGSSLLRGSHSCFRADDIQVLCVHDSVERRVGQLRQGNGRAPPSWALSRCSATVRPWRRAGKAVRQKADVQEQLATTPFAHTVRLPPSRPDQFSPTQVFSSSIFSLASHSNVVGIIRSRSRADEEVGAPTKK